MGDEGRHGNAVAPPGRRFAPLSYRRFTFMWTTAGLRLLMPLIAKVRIGAVEPPPKPGAAGLIVAANHRSHLDFFVGLLAFRKWKLQPHVLVHRDAWETPVLRFLLSGLEAIPAQGAWDGDGLLRAKELLREGHVLAITPEARITGPDERVQGLGRVRGGVARLAAGSGAPILLMGMVNTDAVWPHGARAPRLSLWPRTRPLIRVSGELLAVPAGAGAAEIQRAVRSGLIRVLSKLEH